MALDRGDYLDQAKPPYGKREVRLGSPNISDLVVIEAIPISPEKYRALPPGTPHQDYAINGLVLVYQGPVKAANNQIHVARVYANKNTVQDWYNYAVKFSGDAAGAPIFVRTYTMLRSEFVPATRGSPFTGVYALQVTNGGSNYTAAPTVVFSGGLGVAATAIMSPPDTNGKMTVIGLYLTNEGTGGAVPTVSFTGGGGSGAMATAFVQPGTALLVKEEMAQEDDAQMASLFVKVTRVYETLPGPFLIWNTYEDEKAGGQRNRGKVQKKSQSVLAIGNEQSSFVRIGGGQAQRTWYEPRGESAIVLLKYIETWTEIVIHDQEITEEFFGGILSVDETRDEPGVQTLDAGFLVTSSSTRTVSPDEQIKTTKQRLNGNWEEVTGCETDEKFGIVVDIAKKVVPAGTAYPGVSMSLDTPYIDIQPHSIWRSIQIASKVRLPLPDPEFYPIERPLHIPGTLLSVEAVWDDIESKLVEALAKSAHVAVSSGAGGGVIVRRTAGFHGLAIGIAERLWFFGPPVLADLPTPVNIIGSAGSVVLFSTHSSTHYALQDDGGVSFGDQYQNQIHSTDVNDLLVGDYDVINPNHFSPPQSALAISGGGSVAAVSAAGTLAKMSVNIPASTPAKMADVVTSFHGLTRALLVDVIVERWRLGVWTVVLEYVQVPAIIA